MAAGRRSERALTAIGSRVAIVVLLPRQAAVTIADCALGRHRERPRQHAVVTRRHGWLPQAKCPPSSSLTFDPLNQYTAVRMHGMPPPSTRCALDKVRVFSMR